MSADSAPASARLEELLRTTRLTAELDAAYVGALAERDAAIVRAASAGLSRRRIGAAVGLSAARVQQICNAAKLASRQGHDALSSGPPRLG